MTAHDIPAWARGHALDELQAIADRFAQHDGELARGALVRTSRPVVANWLATGMLDGWPRGPLVVSAISKCDTPVNDFTRRPVARLPRGGLHVYRVAFTVDQLDGLAARLRREPVVLVELWAESQLHRTLARHARLRRLGTKIRSTSELIALWGRGCAVTAQHESELIGLRRLALDFDVTAAVDELRHVAGWTDHYSNYNAAHSWSAVALRGYGGRVDYIVKPVEMVRSWRDKHPEQLKLTCENTELWDRMPACRAIVDALPGRKERVRLMRLTSNGGELQRHTDLGDPDSGIANGRIARVHVPLVTDADVEFTTWALDDGRPQTVRMRTGESWYLDTRKPHAARNDSDRERVHLVVDVHSSRELRALLLPERT